MYSVELYVLLIMILLCQGYPQTKKDQGFGYQESEERDPSLHNAQVSKYSYGYEFKCVSFD